MRIAQEQDVPELIELYNNGRDFAHEVGYIDWPHFTAETIQEMMVAGELHCFDSSNGIDAAVKLGQQPDPRIWGDDITPAIYVSKLCRASNQSGADFVINEVLPKITIYASEAGRIRGDCIASNDRLKNLYIGLGMNCLGDVTFYSEKQNRTLTVTKLEKVI